MLSNALSIVPCRTDFFNILKDMHELLHQDLHIHITRGVLCASRICSFKDLAHHVLL